MSSNVRDMFFKELKEYNPTNFRAILRSDLSNPGPGIYKTFSSVVTRYFIFCEHHPEVDPVTLRILFFDVGIDTIAAYFAAYDNSDLTNLIEFQNKLIDFCNRSKEVTNV